jgi:TonB family protein
MFQLEISRLAQLAKPSLSFGAVTLATVLAFWPLCLSGQRASELLDALSQIRAHRLDSAITLLHTITTSRQADSSERADAFLWLGVASFYKGQDSAAGAAFRDALGINALMTPAGVLAKLDSGVAALWEREQTRALCDEALPAWLPPSSPSLTPDPLNSEARAAQSPAIVSGPQLWYPDNLRRAGIQGRVLARAIIDTLGRAERRSVRILWTAHPDFNDPVIEYIKHAHFSVAVWGARRTRACVVVPVSFTIKR